MRATRGYGQGVAVGILLLVCGSAGDGYAQAQAEDWRAKLNPGGDTLFAEGVTLKSGWYDVNKLYDGVARDAPLCWLISSMNVAQWFVDRYLALGHPLPPTWPYGRGK